MNRLAFAVLIMIAFGRLQAQPMGLDSAKIIDPARLASSDLRGNVTDASTGKPLSGASIMLVDLRLGTMCDANGAFVLLNISDGVYVVEVSFQGYASLVKTVSIKGNTQVNFSLSPTAVESENVVITGVSKATELKKSPVPISIMKKQELYRSSASNIIEALTRKSGVSALTTGQAIAKPFIRGMGYNRVVTLNDGIRQEGQQWGDEHGIEIDEYSVQKAEVLRGPASLMYGSDALGGVLNIISQPNVPQDHMQANVVLSNNTNSRLWGAHANIAGNTNGVLFGAYGSFKNAGDYKNKYDGYVLNSRFNEADFGGTIGVNKKWGYSHLTFSNFNQQTGMIEGDRNDEGQFVLFPNTALERVATTEDLKSREVFVPYQRINHMKVVSDNSFAMGKNRVTITAGWQMNKRQEFGEPDHPDEAEAWFDLRTFNYNAGYHFQERNGWKSTLGVNGMFQTNTNKGEEAIIPDYGLTDIGGYFVTQKALGANTTLSGGLRLDNRQLKLEERKNDNGDMQFTAFNRSFTNVSGSVGVSHQAGKNFTFKGNISRGFRAPNAAELGSNGAHEGTNRYEVGNPNLKSETSLQLDLGIEWYNEHVNVGFTPFFSNVGNYIYFEKLQSVTGGDSLIDQGNGDFAKVFDFKQQTANLTGFELNVDLHPHPLDWLHVENTISYVRGWFTKPIDGTTNLPMIAPFRWLSELRTDIGSKRNTGTLRNTYFKLEMDWNAAQNRAFIAYNTETSTKAFVLINAGVGTDFKSASGKTVASLYINANNIFDVAYQSHLSRLKYTAENLATGRMGVFNMGRNFTFRVVVPMQWHLKN